MITLTTLTGPDHYKARSRCAAGILGFLATCIHAVDFMLSSERHIYMQYIDMALRVGCGILHPVPDPAIIS